MAARKRAGEEEVKEVEAGTLVQFLSALNSHGLQKIMRTGVYDPILRRESDEAFASMLNDAVEFCNNKKNKRRQEMKAYLEAYCAATDVKARRQPLANALNVVLKEFRNKKYSLLPVNTGRWDKEEVIFLPNDPTLTTTKRSSGAWLLKPDVIAVYYGSICDRRIELHGLEFEQMLAAIADGSVRKAEMRDARKEGKNEDEYSEESEEESDDDDEEIVEEGKSDKMEVDEQQNVPEMESRKKISWIDVHQSWKLKANEGTKLSFIERVWSAGDKKIDIVSTEQTVSDKEDEEDESPSSEAGYYSNEKVKEIALDVQSNVFAAERLSSAWIMGHSTTVTIEDTSIILRMYDAQQTLKTEPVDFLEQLPAFVLLAIVFQRFDSRMWGMMQRDTRRQVVGGKTFLLEEKRPDLKLHGRRTFTTNARLIASDEDSS